ncbi:hypothetical protein TNCV_4312731 [Trichonephila clavipes]|nr:hypothetical protein TNCV_4312731 [Trichonephila clavipes]
MDPPGTIGSVPLNCIENCAFAEVCIYQQEKIHFIKNQRTNLQKGLADISTITPYLSHSKSVYNGWKKFYQDLTLIIGISAHFFLDQRLKSPENRRVRFQCGRDYRDQSMDQLVTVLFTDEYFLRTEESVSNWAEIEAWINCGDCSLHR